MPLLKPTRGLQINLAHPMARGLVGCWLLNEGTGPAIFDLSKNKNNGSVQGAVPWAAGRFGSALDIPSTGNTNYVEISNAKGFGAEGTFVWWANIDTLVDYGGSISTKDSGGNTAQRIYTRSAGTFRYYHYNTDNSAEIGVWPSWSNTGYWTQFACTWSGAAGRLYIDGLLKAEDTTISGTLRTPAQILLGTDLGNANRGMDGRLDHVLAWNRVLSADEIASLYSKPFCIFQRKVSPCLLFVPTGQIVSLAGTCAAGSNVTASLKLTRCIAGALAAQAQVYGCLTVVGEAPPAEQWFSGSLNIEQDWLLAALFGGMTANAFKLGTALTLGWFWMRRSGCSALYRGPTIDQIDFTNALTVAEQDAGQISPPTYVAHGSNSTYFYAIRRFNACGYQERTLAAVAKVAIDAGGNLTAPQPNNIFAAAAEQVDGNKVQLTWFYCPLQQESRPLCFRIYHDAATGQIDYQNPLGTIIYQGQKFYTYLTGPLAGGRYLFAVLAEDADGVQNGSLARSIIQLTPEFPEAIDILSAESV